VLFIDPRILNCFKFGLYHSKFYIPDASIKLVANDVTGSGRTVFLKVASQKLSLSAKENNKTASSKFHLPQTPRIGEKMLNTRLFIVQTNIVLFDVTRRQSHIATYYVNETAIWALQELDLLQGRIKGRASWAAAQISTCKER
jgi:hypothetical protein